MKVECSQKYTMNEKERRSLDTVCDLYNRLIAISENGIIGYFNGNEYVTFTTSDLLTMKFDNLYLILKNGFEEFHEGEF